MDIETARPDELRKYILDLNVRLVQAIAAYEHTMTHYKKATTQIGVLCRRLDEESALREKVELEIKQLRKTIKTNGSGKAK